MARPNSIWWNKQKQSWCVEIDGKRLTLAKGRANKRAASKALTEHLRERELLSKVDGFISVAGLCERFLEDASERLAPATFESYQYSVQKLVDELGGRAAHTIRPDDISKFCRKLKSSLNDSSLGIVLRSVQRCFNWGVEERLIPPHELGRIRKPRSRVRQRLLTDDEFRALLRSTNSSRDDGIGAPFRRLLLAMEWTGCRPSELANLRWADICFEKNVAILWKHKTERTGAPKVIPIIQKFKRLLCWLKAQSDSDLVFLNSRKQAWNRHSIAKRMVKARTKAGLSADVVMYLMRHRVATKVLARTSDLKMTSMLLNHTSVRVTERYIHATNATLIDFANRALD